MHLFSILDLSVFIALVIVICTVAAVLIERTNRKK
jgi:hypothetical protein